MMMRQCYILARFVLLASWCVCPVRPSPVYAQRQQLDISLRSVHHFTSSFNKSNTKSLHEYKEDSIEQDIDHFNAKDQRKLKIRYLYNDEHYDRDEGSVLFYCGNEAPIEVFWESTGLMHEAAPKLKAMVLFAEHRYFGKSMPSDPVSRTMHFNTVEQVLEDFVYLLVELKKKNFISPISPVVAFGGSYGGMLAAYLRYRYPHIVVGSIAASAPIWQYSRHLVSPYAFMKRVTDTFDEAGQALHFPCADVIQSSLLSMYRIMARNDDYEAEGNVDSGGRVSSSSPSPSPSSLMSELSKSLNTCKPLTKVTDISMVIDWFKESFSALAMVDYPYPADFYFGAHPGWPVHKYCNSLKMNLTKDKGGMGGEEERDVSRVDGTAGESLGLGDVVNVWKYMREAADATGLSEAHKCLDINNSDDNSSPEDEIGAWGYLACTSQAMPMGTNGQSDMFPPEPFDETLYSEQCYHNWGVRPDYSWGDRFLGTDYFKCSNTVFSNGALDPWSTGAPHTSLSPSCPVLWLKDGAHHYDLRGTHSVDTPEVKEVRAVEMKLIEEWISSYRVQTALQRDSRRVPVEPLIEATPTSSTIEYPAVTH